MGFFDFLFMRSKKDPPKPQPQPAAQSQIVDNGANEPDETIIDYAQPISSTQQDVLDYLANNPQGITFVHGKAGCGKTYLIKKIEAANHGCQVLTPTNLAASLYKRAKTLHSFFGKYSTIWKKDSKTHKI